MPSTSGCTLRQFSLPLIFLRAIKAQSKAKTDCLYTTHGLRAVRVQWRKLELWVVTLLLLQDKPGKTSVTT